MQKEKSCGALIFRRPDGSTEPELLLVRHRKGGHWSFPKGHVEAGETEEQTATREVKEETGLDLRILPGFKESVRYAPKPGVMKTVVYFLGEPAGGVLCPQESEIKELSWFPLSVALGKVTYQNDISLIQGAASALPPDKIRE